MDITSFQESLEHWGYLLLFFASFGGGYTGIVAAGILSAMGGMSISLCILVAFVGNLIGSSALACLARTQKKDMMRYLKKHRRKLALAHFWLRRYGVWLIFFSKYIYGVKTIVPLAIGISKYNLKKFVLYNLPASGIWAAVVGLLSFYASHGVKEIFKVFGNIPTPLVFAIGLAVVAIIWILLKVYSKKKIKLR